MAHTFLTNHCIAIDKSFIKKYKSDELNTFNFRKCKINLFDYRRLVDMLVRHNPDKYIPLSKPEQPYDFIKEIQEFLKGLY